KVPLLPTCPADQLVVRTATGWACTASAANAQSLGGRSADLYSLKSDTSANSFQLGGLDSTQYALKSDTVANAGKLGGVDAASYALKTDTVANASKLGGQPPSAYASAVNGISLHIYGNGSAGPKTVAANASLTDSNLMFTDFTVNEGVT